MNILIMIRVGGQLSREKRKKDEIRMTKWTFLDW
jgi:hypothetical protein